MMIHEIDRVGAQGDLLLMRVERVPERANEQKPTNGRHVLARGDSAAGEHFVNVAGAVRYFVENDRTAYLMIEQSADVEHGRATDTHETLRLGAGIWMVRRQREHTPDGFRRVED